MYAQLLCPAACSAVQGRSGDAQVGTPIQLLHSFSPPGQHVKLLGSTLCPYPDHAREKPRMRAPVDDADEERIDKRCNMCGDGDYFALSDVISLESDHLAFLGPGTYHGVKRRRTTIAN